MSETAKGYNPSVGTSRSRTRAPLERRVRMIKGEMWYSTSGACWSLTSWASAVSLGFRRGTGGTGGFGQLGELSGVSARTTSAVKVQELG